MYLIQQVPEFNKVPEFDKALGGRPLLLRTPHPPRGREGRGPCREDYAATGLKSLTPGSNQPHQKADQYNSAKQHGPIPHVELKKTTVCCNLHIREHDLLCCIAMDWPVRLIYHDGVTLAVTRMQRQRILCFRSIRPGNANPAI